MALFQRVCELDLEGIVAKQKSGGLRHGARAKYVVQDFESGIFAEGRQRGIVREGTTSGTCCRLAFVRFGLCQS